MPLKCHRSHISDNLFTLEKVTDFSITATFDCRDEDQEEDLNDFFQNDAIHYQKDLLAETYALYLSEHKKAIGPLAFVSLANDTIKLSKSLKRRLIHHTKRYIDDFPAVKIARLGVDSSFQGKGIGTHILNLLKTFFTTDNRTGCRFMTVDAYNKKRVLKFYQRNEFDFLHDKDEQARTRIMFYDLIRFAAPPLPLENLKQKRPPRARTASGQGTRSRRAGAKEKPRKIHGHHNRPTIQTVLNNCA